MSNLRVQTRSRLSENQRIETRWHITLMTARKNTWKRSISFIYSTVSSLKERVGLIFFLLLLFWFLHWFNKFQTLREQKASTRVCSDCWASVSTIRLQSLSLNEPTLFIYLFISFGVYWSSAFLLDEAYWPIASQRKQSRLGIRGLNWSGGVNLRRRTFVPPWSEEGFFLLLISPWWGTGHPRVVLLPFPKPIHAKDLMGDLGD